MTEIYKNQLLKVKQEENLILRREKLQILFGAIVHERAALLVMEDEIRKLLTISEITIRASIARAEKTKLAQQEITKIAGLNIETILEYMNKEERKKTAGPKRY